jgi:hypothetical protein
MAQQHSWKSSDFIEVIKKLQRYILRINSSNKIPSAVKRASILDLKLVQAFARVSLAKEPHHLLHLLDQILEFFVRLCIVIQRRHTKLSKWLQSGELGGQTSSTHTCVRFPQSCIILLSWAGVLLKDVMAISGYLSASFDNIFSYLFWKCSNFLSS